MRFLVVAKYIYQFATREPRRQLNFSRPENSPLRTLHLSGANCRRYFHLLAEPAEQPEQHHLAEWFLTWSSTLRRITQVRRALRQARVDAVRLHSSLCPLISRLPQCHTLSLWVARFPVPPLPLKHVPRNACVIFFFFCQAIFQPEQLFQ